MRVRELMSTPVAFLAPSDTLESAEDLMITSRVRHLPVLDGDRLVGLVSLSDLLAASISWLRDPSSDEDRAAKRRYLVEEVMRRSLETARPEDDAIAAADVFLAQKISCLPVVDERYDLVGILTDTDFVRLARGGLVAQSHAAEVRRAKAPRREKSVPAARTSRTPARGRKAKAAPVVKKPKKGVRKRGRTMS